MSGLRWMCRLYGEMTFKDINGKTIHWVWDYAKDEPRLKDEMTAEEKIASERARWELMKSNFDKK